jgi:molybdopterin molybdotransferase
MTLLPVAEAQERVLALGAPLPIEQAPLADAAGRWAAADVVARRDQPAADLSAMDGYALRFGERPGPWTLAGESKAGPGLPPPLVLGAAARIFTGAPMPEGADTVLIQEEAVREGAVLRPTGPAPTTSGEHVRPRGSDFRTGARLVAAGERWTPARIALAAIGGHGHVPVRRRPRVVLLSTGDELVRPGEPTPGVALPASNTPMLQALLGSTSAIVTEGELLPDRLDALADGFARAAGQADIIVTTGGVSVGDHDLVRPAFEQAGAALDFWRVAMRPGKPLMAGRLGGAIVLGLPGNPVSALVTAHLFLLPLVDHLAGNPAPLPVAKQATLAEGLPAAGSRTEYVRGRMAADRVSPVGERDSAALLAIAAADVLIVRKAGAPTAVPGESVDIIRIA